MVFRFQKYNDSYSRAWLLTRVFSKGDGHLKYRWVNAANLRMIFYFKQFKEWNCDTTSSVEVIWLQTLMCQTSPKLIFNGQEI